MMEEEADCYEEWHDMTLVKIMEGSTFPYPPRGKNNTLSSELIHLGVHKTIDQKK